MYSNLQLAKKFLRYYVTAANGRGHGIHSPFVFAFVRDVLQNQMRYAHPPGVEVLRKQLLRSTETIAIQDFGAGSRKGQASVKKVSELAASVLKPPKFGRLLYRVVRHFRPQTILELGTSFGMTTAYMALANPGARVVTIEGNPAVAARAEQHFRELNIPNIEVITGNFDDVLPRLLPSLGSVDFCYVDGNHREEPTLRYHQMLKPCLHKSSIVVFDDVHWSPGMERAWQAIRDDAAVTCTIDLFFLGFTFYNPDMKVKQDFVIRF